MSTPTTTSTSLLDRVSVADGREIPDAATGEIIGRTVEQSVDDLDEMVERAAAAQPAWAARSMAERGELLHAAAERIEAHADELAALVSREQGKPLNDARARGARIVTGGEPATELGPLFFQATIIADVKDGDPIVDEEQFGPALPIIKYTDLDDAIRSANRLEAALGASVWSDDATAAREVALRLEAGTVWINKHGGIHPLVPFGGIKGSGYGLEFGIEGLKSVSVPVVITSR
ncbi:aldehyde dehydrogenase family protein [Gryllotalpicola ginsengisoli]|uniref:aldehyde dehydrogenase family protein n=1 Tax=Gryllotalpicola ginsengisoli TaxID=444608 RepID=UPI0003B3DB94|nr:aldehyde dehydrogenase family protein [Gryllotalpicola ginsengisoli]